VLTHGLLCTVDLFRVPVTAKAPKDSPTCTTSSPRSQKATQTSDGFVHFNPPGLPLAESLAPSPPYRPHSYGPSDIVHYYDGHPLLESSKNTPYLVGATFVQPVLVELSGQKCIVFVFSVCRNTSISLGVYLFTLSRISLSKARERSPSGIESSISSHQLRIRGGRSLHHRQCIEVHLVRNLLPQRPPIQSRRPNCQQLQL
jgi:hypothetical protein